MHSDHPWLQADVRDSSGVVFGVLDRVLFDPAGDQRGWAAVRIGSHGVRVSIVPLDGAQLHAGMVVVRCSRALARDAPNVPVSPTLAVADAMRLRQHYRLRATPSEPDSAPA